MSDNKFDLRKVDDNVIWDEYERRVERLGDRIVDEMEERSCYAGDDTFDGYRWCEENDVPQSVFSDAVEAKYDKIEYGVSPLYPWLIPEKYR